MKVSADAADWVALTPVTLQEWPLERLMDRLLALTRKDAVRIQDLLRRGTLTSGSGRLRWDPIHAPLEEIEGLLRAYPENEPARLFAAERCIRALLGRVEITKEAGEVRRFLKRSTFWGELMRVAEAGAPQYVEYSYRDRADLFRLPCSVEQVRDIRQSARLLNYTRLQQQVETESFSALDLYVVRE